MRWEKCGICGEYHPVSPLYERVYEDHAKDGRFTRLLWVCGQCLQALREGRVLRRDRDGTVHLRTP